MTKLVTLAHLHTERWQKHAPLALLDIGSNSVRLQILREWHPSPREAHNEKFMVALGADLNNPNAANAGNIGPAKAQLLASVLKRYQQIIENFLPHIPTSNIVCLATAVLRDAGNGRLLSQQLSQQLGWPIRIISGETEALLAALGAQTGNAPVHGLLGDLGGGSLELVDLTSLWQRFRRQQVWREDLLRYACSLPLGVHRLHGLWAKGPAPATKKLAPFMATASFALAQTTFTEMTVAGGSWRTIGKIYRRLHDFPDQNIDQFNLRSSQLLPLLRQLERRPQNWLSWYPERASTLPQAAWLLRNILTHWQIGQVHFTEGGILHGVVAAANSRLPAAVTPVDAESLALQRWLRRSPLSPLWPPELLARAAALATRWGPDWHKNRRARMAALTAESTNAYGTEIERAWLGVAMAHRFGPGPAASSLRHLLNPRDYQSAALLGLTLRLLWQLSGGAAGLWPKIRLTADGRKLQLVAPANLLPARTPKIAKLWEEVRTLALKLKFYAHSD